MKRNLIPVLVAQAFQKDARNRSNHHGTRPRLGVGEFLCDERNAKCRNGTADEPAGKTGKKETVAADARNVGQPVVYLFGRLECREPSQKGGNQDRNRTQLARARPQGATDGKEDAEVDRRQRRHALDRKIPECVISIVAIE